ncbi:MAG: branched-chain amino acid ABC transporter substrate-binding protein [Proteobacteria bacterium]|nr:MAG: branched-chain amino acid ABC transporter substrate-binding protein [Pseudomonadota bacterium]
MTRAILGNAIRASLLSLAVASLLSSPAWGEKRYGPGVSDTEIKIGQTMPYSGPLSAFGTMGRAQLAYFEMVNARGGVNGRKVTLISLDDGYSPPKSIEQTRKLVEAEEVLLLFSSFGTPPNTATMKYLNARKVPQLFIAATGMKWGDPRSAPWTMAFLPSQKTGTVAYAHYLLKQRPNAKIGVLYQNDDFGKDYVKALRDHLAERADKLIVMEASYESSDPSIDSQIASLKGSGADTFFSFTSPKFSAQAIRKAHDIGWKPLFFLPYSATSVSSVLQPAGFDKAAGVISSAYVKDPSDPQWKNDVATRGWLAWMKKYYPEGDVADLFNVYAYTNAQLLIEVLRRCGDELTRDNVMKQAASLAGVELPMLLPGVTINTSPTDYDPIKQLQLMRFDGKQWIRFGEVVGR